MKKLKSMSGYKETSLLWSLSGKHIYDKNMCMKTNEEIDEALTHLYIDGVLERLIGREVKNERI